MSKIRDFLWVEKYRPSDWSTYIFHDERQRRSFEKMTSEKMIPNLLFAGTQGTGKAQPVWEKVLTQQGWRCIGDLLPGDKIYTVSGELTDVVGVFPQGEKEIYAVQFSDGTTVYATGDHLWTVTIKQLTDAVETKTLTTEEISKIVKQDIIILTPRVNSVVSHNIREIDVEKYVEVIERYRYQKDVQPLLDMQWFDLTVKQRVELIDRITNGLLDCIDTLNKYVEQFVVECARSLGYYVSVSTSQESEIRNIFIVNDAVDGTVCGDRIVSVKPTGFNEQSVCIKVSDQSSLYITSNFKVTHNTTAASILINQLEIPEHDLLYLNASKDNKVETVRDLISSFVSRRPLGKFRVVRLEEADYITPNGQAILRMMIEQYADTARFILTCNYLTKIIKPIQSRCQIFNFTAPDKQQFEQYLKRILEAENITFEEDVVRQYVQTFYPDVRLAVNSMQTMITQNNVLQPPTAVATGEWERALDLIIKTDRWDQLINITKMVDSTQYDAVYRHLYKNLHKSKTFAKGTAKWRLAIVEIAEYMYRNASVADSELNFAALAVKLEGISTQ